MKIKVASSDFVPSISKTDGLKKAVEIPAEIEALAKRLAQKYKLDFEAVAVRGKLLYFLHVADLEPLVAGRDVFANASEFPFWVKVWEASVMMANLVSSLRPEPGMRMLELGAGLAVPSISAAVNGHAVTVTDYEEDILDFVRVSAAVNRCSENVTCRKLDWLAPETAELGSFDCIIGSEILFNEKFFKPLLNVFHNLLAPDGVIFMAHNVERRSLAPFLRMCSPDFRISAQKKRIRAGHRDFDIVLNRMVRTG